jgi:hypothetical protein
MFTFAGKNCASSGIDHYIPGLSNDDYFDDNKLYFTLYFDYERENDTISEYTQVMSQKHCHSQKYRLHYSL